MLQQAREQAATDEKVEHFKHNVETLAKKKNVLTEGDDRERAMRSVRQQGDLGLYEKDCLMQRMAIYQSEALKEIFVALYESLPLDQKGRLTEKGYKWLYRRLYWKVVPEGRRADCDKLADEEWKKESQGDGYMDFEEFFDSMFTFIDVWVEGLEEEAYVQYAEKMCLPLMNELGKSSVGLTDRRRGQKVFMPPDLHGYIHEITVSNVRINGYVSAGMSTSAVYQSECDRLGIEPTVRVMEALTASQSKAADKDHRLKEIKLANIKLTNIGPLVDVIRMNTRLEGIYLQNCCLSGSSISLLCHILLEHKKLQVLDISKNEVVGMKEVSDLHRLLVRRPNITVCRFNQTIPNVVRGALQLQLEVNLRANFIPMKEYRALREAFQVMDHNKNGKVEIKELEAYLSNNPTFSKVQNLKDKKGPRTSTKAQKGTASTAKPQKPQNNLLTSAKTKQMAKQMIGKTDDNADNELDMAEMFTYFYPNISTPAMIRILEQYETNGEASLAQKYLTADSIEKIFKDLDLDQSGTLSLQELQKGAAKMGVKSLMDQYSKELKKYDINGDDEFELEEFVLLMEVIDGCNIEACLRPAKAS
uniref:EF-hand domain-containing protein n=1 Tax=Eutreptiella gymnastica TaxID=73025 RepID=A0A7S1NER1_9EUGL